MRSLLCLTMLGALSPAQTLSSPDGLIQLTLSVSSGQLTYDVSYRSKPLIVRAALGLEIQSQRVLGANVEIVNSTPAKIDETYTVPVGKSNPVRNLANAMTFEVREPAPPNRRLTIEARAYNDGVAFRYLIPDQPAISALRIVNEKTEFRFPSDPTTYPLILRNFRTSWEDNYRTVALSGIHPESLVGTPLLVEMPGSAWLAITEANLDNYPGIYLMHSESNARTLLARLSPRIDEPGISAALQTPARSPWRVIMIAGDPGRLIESNLILNLNPPCAIADTSWIKPGKAAWNWWSGSHAEGVDFKPGMNTATMRHYIDFAGRSGFEYMLIDAGWAAHGTGPNDSAADITTPQPDIDMPALLAFAKSKNVRLWVWAHWSDVERQMDEAFALYEKWGLAGVKIDFMDRDDQWMTNYYRRVVSKAAAHHLMIDFHGAFKPDGLRRTYPNLMTREGVLGMEYNKWSARDTPDHHVMLAFTRMLAGPLDYTPGGFRNATREQFVPRNLQPMVMGTRAHQLALFVVFESPLEMVSDSPEVYQGQQEFEFIRAAPATWDQTRVLNAKVGGWVTVARRYGAEWYLGSIAGSTGGELEIPLDFLDPGEYTAEIWSDAADASANPTHTAFEQQKVTRATRLQAKLVDGGGHALPHPAHAMTMRVLALADDLTGALEVGAKFAECGLRARVTIRPSLGAADAEVLVVDTETRHQPPPIAFETVRRLAAEARALGVPLIYKKTDSTLRGNTGAELGAMLAAAPSSPLLYGPAYPAMGRTVQGGRLHVNGIPVHQTAFARDPLNPVTESEIARVIASQWDGPLRSSAYPGAMQAGEICVLDGATDADVAAAARAVLQSGCALAAGPAALAGELAAQLGGPARQPELPQLATCLVVNGSLHEVSARQIATALAAGWPVGGPGWAIIHERWDRMGEALPRLTRELAPDGLVIFGGDTAFAILEGLGCSCLDSICEVAPGVPLSRWGPLHIVTKAGGFGPDSILLQLRGLLDRT